MLEGGLRCWLWLAAWFRPPALLPPTPPCWLLVSTGECATIALTFAVRSLDSAGGCGGMKNLTIEIVLKVTVFVWYYFLFWFRGIDDFSKSAKWDPFCTFWKLGALRDDGSRMRILLWFSTWHWIIDMNLYSSYFHRLNALFSFWNCNDDDNDEVKWENFYCCLVMLSNQSHNPFFITITITISRVFSVFPCRNVLHQEGFFFSCFWKHFFCITWCAL